nr:quinone oxidoreductase [Quercus suber]
MATQRAYRLHSYGGPESITLDNVPVPTPGKGQVLVAVSKVGMNPFDWKIREGYVKERLPLKLPAILGVDFVGRVVALGEAASRFKVGDRVMTMSRSLGAYAEHIAIDESILARVPEALSDADAATIPIPGLSAWQTVHAAGPLHAGMKVLIHGASGTVGAFAVQFAKAAGAKVFGTASGKNRQYVLGLGADEFIDYQTEKFEDRVQDVDLILDYVLLGGSNNTTDRSWSMLKPNGALVSVADPSTAFKAPEGLKGLFPQIYPDVSQMEEIAEKLTSGNIQSKIGRVFNGSQLLEAMELNKLGGTAGRLIVDFERF